MTEPVNHTLAYLRRLEGREVETTGLKALFDRHERRLAELGRHRAARGRPERVNLTRFTKHVGIEKPFFPHRS
jgi:hypothetical protein